MRIDSQPAYVLHSRLYRDSSLIVEFLTQGYGRVSGVVKGVRGSGKSAKQRRSLMQPFVPLAIDWSGNTDLKTVIRFEAIAAPFAVHGERLFSGLYINELLTRVLQHYDEHPYWFELYQQVLTELSSAQPVDIVLRRFELALLEELGYGIDLSAEALSGASIEPQGFYVFDPQQGFCRRDEIPDNARACAFSGHDILAIAAGDFSESARRSAKRLCRLALAVHLGAKPLKSRELFG